VTDTIDGALIAGSHLASAPKPDRLVLTTYA
jgi:hypothetical protein